jgi:hypothetical protein
VLGSNHIKDADGEQSKSHHQKPGDCASVEGVPKGGSTANGSGLGRPNIRHDGNPHSAKSGEKAACGTDQEANSRGQVFKVANGGEKKKGDARDGLKLAVQIGSGSFLNGGGNFSHLFVSIGLTLDPYNESPGRSEADGSRDEAEWEGLVQKKVCHSKLMKSRC